MVVVRRLLPRRLRRLLAGFRRAAAKPPVGGVQWGDLRSLVPVSRDWGFDRGRPIDRYYIEGFLQSHASDIRGRVLEVDTDRYTRMFGGAKVERCDVLKLSPGRGATIVADLADGEAIPSEAFDCAIITQTLQLIFEPRRALATLHRVLKPGGVLLATVPGISKMTSDAAGSWACYWGFTSASLRRSLDTVFSGGRVAIEAPGNVLAAMAFLQGFAAEELSEMELEHDDPEYELLLMARATKAEKAP